MAAHFCRPCQQAPQKRPLRGALCSVPPRAKADLHEIWQAETREAAIKAFDHFLKKYGAKYDQACEILKKDRVVLLIFYDFPAEHWRHLRTTNPIESTFATIRLRHRRADRNGD
jgi:putative transposase